METKKHQKTSLERGTVETKSRLYPRESKSILNLKKRRSPLAQGNKERPKDIISKGRKGDWVAKSTKKWRGTKEGIFQWQHSG